MHKYLYIYISIYIYIIYLYIHIHVFINLFVYLYTQPSIVHHWQAWVDNARQAVPQCRPEATEATGGASVAPEEATLKARGSSENYPWLIVVN